MEHNRGARPLKRRYQSFGNGIPLNRQTGRKAITLKYSYPLGDLVMATSVLNFLNCLSEDIDLYVDFGNPAVVANNPYIKIGKNNRSQIVTIDHNSAYEFAKNTKCLITQAMIFNVLNQLGLQSIKSLAEFYNLPELYWKETVDTLANEIEFGKDYCVINPGYKFDKDLKWWGLKNWTKLIGLLNKQGIKVIQIGSLDNCYNPRFKGVIDLVGKTDLNTLFALVDRSIFTISAESSLNHIAAGLKKTSIVIGGGLEFPYRVTYPTTIYLDTIGELDCCKYKACDNFRTNPKGDNKFFDSRICLNTIEETTSVLHDCTYQIGKCMQLITPEKVMAEVVNIV